jgi:hypothetical protein
MHAVNRQSRKTCACYSATDKKLFSSKAFLPKLEHLGRFKLLNWGRKMKICRKIVARNAPRTALFTACTRTVPHYVRPRVCYPGMGH